MPSTLSMWECGYQLRMYVKIFKQTWYEQKKEEPLRHKRKYANNLLTQHRENRNQKQETTMPGRYIMVKRENIYTMN